MPVASLHSMAMRATIKHVDGVETLEGLYWESAEPILRRITSARQLAAVEATLVEQQRYTNQDDGLIVDRMEGIWRSLITRAFPDISLPDKLKEGWTWHRIYKKCAEVKEKNRQERSQRLAEKLQANTDQKKANQLEFAKGPIKACNAPTGRVPLGAGREHWGKRNLGKPDTPGQKMLKKAQRESRIARQVNRTSIKPAVGVPFSRQTAMTPRTAASISGLRTPSQAASTHAQAGSREKQGPAPLNREAMAALKAKRERAAGVTPAQGASSRTETIHKQSPAAPVQGTKRKPETGAFSISAESMGTKRKREPDSIFASSGPPKRPRMQTDPSCLRV